jgi:hypothetical protein
MSLQDKKLGDFVNILVVYPKHFWSHCFHVEHVVVQTAAPRRVLRKRT